MKTIIKKDYGIIVSDYIQNIGASVHHALSNDANKPIINQLQVAIQNYAEEEKWESLKKVYPFSEVYNTLNGNMQNLGDLCQQQEIDLTDTNKEDIKKKLIERLLLIVKKLSPQTTHGSEVDIDSTTQELRRNDSDRSTVAISEDSEEVSIEEAKRRIVNAKEQITLLEELVDRRESEGAITVLFPKTIAESRPKTSPRNPKSSDKKEQITIAP
jgi:hypothetical protein